MFQLYSELLGLPILLSVFISLLFHQVFTTTIMIQNVLFVLYLAMVFYKTHFRDQTITARRFSHACYHQRCGETRWRRAFNCHARHPKQIHD